MPNYFQQLWGRLTATTNATVDNEVERIAALQRAAVERRKEYAVVKEKAANTDSASLADALSASRRLMEQAESAHMTALQRWQNKQARQRSY